MYQHLPKGDPARKKFDVPIVSKAYPLMHFCMAFVLQQSHPNPWRWSDVTNVAMLSIRKKQETVQTPNDLLWKGGTALQLAYIQNPMDMNDKWPEKALKSR